MLSPQRKLIRTQLRLHWLFLLALLLLGATFLFLLLSSGGVARAEVAEDARAVVPADNSHLPFVQEDVGVAPSDDACRLCHEDTDAQLTFPDGEALSARVDPDVLAQSAHGSTADSPLKCTSCHQAADYQFPHPPVDVDSLRAYEIDRAQTCETCHQQAHITSHPGVEDENPVICTDCHGAHDVLTGAQWQAGEGVETCVACHEGRGVELANEASLTRVIQGGMFAQRPDNDYCLSCHSLPNLSLTLDSGEKLFLTVDEERFHDSVHGADNPAGILRCTDCHEGYRYPHEPVIAETIREYSLEMYTLCARCHEPKYEETVDSVHGEALEAGVEEAAVCTDCHGNHYTPVPDEPRSRVSYTCRQCHSTIFEQYRHSVHGEALLEEDNPDVAVCTDCHGVHSIGDTDLASFRLGSPEACAECHADEELMEEYGVSTEVFETYVADFHGTTVTLFEIQDPEAATNKAVCYDCHGVHDIRDPDDPEAGIKQRLLETCRQCHPSASENFPDSWTSHFRPSLEHHPTVFLVNLFYQIVIPGTVGFFGFLVLTDVYRRIRRR